MNDMLGDNKTEVPVTPVTPVTTVTTVEPIQAVVTETVVVPVPVTTTETIETVEPITTTDSVESTLPVEGTIEWYQAENSRLREEVNKNFIVDTKTITPTVSDTPIPQVVQPIKIEDFKWADTDFIGNEPLEQLLDTREGLNKLLNIVASKAAELSINQAHERTIRTIPEVVTKYVTNMSTMKNLHDEFYANNEDLQPFKRVCGGIANQIAAEHPDFTVAKVFEETAKQTRQTLGLLAKTPKVVSNTINMSPAFAGPSGSRSTNTVALKGLEKEINDLLT